MDRLAVHVIATAALTVTLATVPVLFADACHAAASSSSSSAAPTAADTRATTHATSHPAALPPAVAVLPALAGQAQTQTPAAPAATGPAQPAPAASGPAPATAGVRPRGRVLLPVLPDRPCADARPIGHTAYARYRGMIAFTVRQYFSPTCHAYYAHAYAWHGFRRLHVPFDVGMAVYNTHSDAIDGAESYLGGEGGPGYWSAAVPARPGQCTRGEGHFFYYPSDAPGGFIEGDTLTSPACT